MIDWKDVTTWYVLVVDDEQDNLEVVAETLEFKGANVQTAVNGAEALKVLDTFSANLILTDLSMPVMDGWKMRYQIKSNEKFSHIPILALSAHAIAGDPERALEAGFDGYLTKPVNIHTLLDDIQTAYVGSTVSSFVATLSDVVSTPSDVVSTPSDVVSTPSDVVSTPSDATSTPSDVVSTPSDVVSTPSDVVSTPSDVVSTPSNIEPKANDKEEVK